MRLVFIRYLSFVLVFKYLMLIFSHDKIQITSLSVITIYYDLLSILY